MANERVLFMNIRLVRLQLDEGVYTYKYYPFEYCCELMKNSQCIKFADKNIDTFDMDDGLASDIPRFCIEKNNIVHDQDDPINWNMNYPIKYCPFCGQQIKIRVMSTKNVKSVRDLLIRTREKLKKQCHSVNDEKEKATIMEEVKKLDKRINSFGTLGDLREIARPKG